jgi:hypothetical protein
MYDSMIGKWIKILEIPLDGAVDHVRDREAVLCGKGPQLAVLFGLDPECGGLASICGLTDCGFPSFQIHGEVFLASSSIFEGPIPNFQSNKRGGRHFPT